MAEKFYVTTPIYYVNARPHIGHAYTTIVADVLARRHRLLGDDVWFLTGTDEHGQKIERASLAAGVPPQTYADEVSASFEGLWKRMGITNHQYIRTTSEAHKTGAQKLFADLYAKGQIYLSTYTGQYSVGEEMFVEGPPGTIGPDGKPTETVTEENFFFRLSRYQLKLLNLIESDELKISPESRRNEVLSFLRGDINDALFQAIYDSKPGDNPDRYELAVEQGLIGRTSPSQSFPSGHGYVVGALKDISVSRSSFTWGISVPEPAASEAKEKHVIYVWLDALANYMTAVGYGENSPEAHAKFARYWPADLHLVGKEIIRFHCVYWPAFLMAAGLPLPKAITAHGWLLFDDSKMSKSKGNIVRTETILEAFGALCPPPAPPPALLSDKGGSSGLQPAEPTNSAEGALAPAHPTPRDRDLFAADVLRYFLLREIPFGQDGSFSFEAMVTRYNADLANGYGNLVSRTLKMIQDFFGGQVPTDTNFAYADSATEKVRFAQEGRASKVVQHVDRCVGISKSAALELAFNVLLGEVCLAITITDRFISDNAPWKLAKEPDSGAREKLTDVLAGAAESIRIVTGILYPFLPVATANVWQQLGLGDITEAAARGELSNLQWGGLKPGTKLGVLGPVFPRADKGLAKIMSDMEAAKTLAHTTAQADATTDTRTEFKTTSLASEIVQSPVEHHAASDPAAGPRTASLPAENPGELVAGSAALTTERPGTPPHQQAQASGIFAGTPSDASPQITIDDFAKVELRVAKVLVCERIPKADKLLRLEVDLGYEKRQILSGIAEWYTPEDLIGRRIVVITNLAPRKMRGLESHGMLLAGSAEGGKPALATFADTDELPLGARLK